MPPYLSIIIVNYNGKKFLHGCVHSIIEHVQCSHEVIIFDNASTDGSVQYLKQHFPDLYVIESEKNVGFSRGNNISAVHARGELLLLLNNDTRLVSSLAPAMDQFAEDERLGVLGCRMSYADGRLQHSMGYEHSPLRIFFSWLGFANITVFPSIFRRVDINAVHYRTTRNDVFWVPGAFLMTRRNLWEKLGGLDERYFMYVEDVDYCKRAKEFGYKVAFTATVEIVHYEAGGKTWIGEKALEHSIKSYIVYFEKFYKKYSIFLVRLGLSVIMTMRMCIYSIASLFVNSGTIKEKRKAYFKAAKILVGVGFRD